MARRSRRLAQPQDRLASQASLATSPGTMFLGPFALRRSALSSSHLDERLVSSPLPQTVSSESVIRVERGYERSTPAQHARAGLDVTTGTIRELIIGLAETEYRLRHRVPYRFRGCGTQLMSPRFVRGRRWNRCGLVLGLFWAMRALPRVSQSESGIGTGQGDVATRSFGRNGRS